MDYNSCNTWLGHTYRASQGGGSAGHLPGTPTHMGAAKASLVPWDSIRANNFFWSPCVFYSAKQCWQKCVKAGTLKLRIIWGTSLYTLLPALFWTVKKTQGDQKVSVHSTQCIPTIPHAIDDLKMAITEYIRYVDRAVLNRVFENTFRRVNKCLEHGGENFWTLLVSFCTVIITCTETFWSPCINKIVFMRCHIISLSEAVSGRPCILIAIISNINNAISRCINSTTILCIVDPVSLINFVNKANLVHNFS